MTIVGSMCDYISREELKSKIRAAFPSLEDRCRINEIVNSIPAAEVNPVRWIPVDEQLPEEYRSVLVCFMSQGGMAQSVSERFDDNRWSALCGFEPVAWMPLPEPPNCGADMRKDKQE